MTAAIPALDTPSTYKDSQARKTKAEQEDLLSKTVTLYVGNLSFYTTEEQIYELFAKCSRPEEGGGIRRIIMGLDSLQKTPCGFCFVEYYLHQEAVDAIRYISGTKLDERVVRCDLDTGYIEGRQYGRGKSGGQVRDEHRQDYDPGRGGWGARAAGREDYDTTRYNDSPDRGPKKRARSPDDTQDPSSNRQRMDR